MIFFFSFNFFSLLTLFQSFFCFALLVFCFCTCTRIRFVSYRYINIFVSYNSKTITEHQPVILIKINSFIWNKRKKAFHLSAILDFHLFHSIHCCFNGWIRLLKLDMCARSTAYYIVLCIYILYDVSRVTRRRLYVFHLWITKETNMFKVSRVN